MAGSKGKTKSKQTKETEENKDTNGKGKTQTTETTGEGSKNQDEKKDGNKRDQKGGGKDRESKKSEYFKEELKRLKTNLEKEKEKINKPEVKDHTPDTFNTLAPYYDTHSAEFLIEKPNDVDHTHSNRPTAQGLCDPWVDHEMDNTLLPKYTPRTPREPAEEEEEEGEQEEEDSEERPKKEGSTHLPKYPAVTMPAGDLGTRTLYYSDVPMLREELKKTYSSSANSKIDAEYKRTKEDFYRMELDKIEEYHPVNRPVMKATYFAYLQNNPGSRKAIVECVKAAEKKQEEKEQQKAQSQEGTPRSRSETPRSQTPRSQRGSQVGTPRSQQGKKQQPAKGGQKAVKA